MKPIRYKVLLAEQLSQADKLTVAAKVSTMYSGPEAAMHSYRRISPAQWVNENWQFEIVDMLGRVVVLKHRGAEVAGFFKRQVTEIEPLPCDPLPEGILKDPQDAWIRFDLLGMSARQVSARVNKQRKAAEEELELAKRQIETKKQLVLELECAINKYKSELETKNAEIKKLRADLKTLGNLSKPTRQLITEGKRRANADMH